MSRSGIGSDSTRAVDPLRQADDAILLDNTDLGFEEQQVLVEQVAERVIRGNEWGDYCGD